MRRDECPYNYRLLTVLTYPERDGVWASSLYATAGEPKIFRDRLSDDERIHRKRTAFPNTRRRIRVAFVIGKEARSRGANYKAERAGCHNVAQSNAR